MSDRIKTTYLELIKPQYVEDADVFDINRNMDVLDTVIHNLDVGVNKAVLTFAPAFVQSNANANGSHVTYEGELYLLPEGHTAGATWENTTKVKTNVVNAITSPAQEIESEIENIQYQLGMLGDLTDYGTGNPLVINASVGTDINVSFTSAASYLKAGKNLCNLGTKTFTQYKRYTLPFTLPAGTYTFSANIELSSYTYTSLALIFYNESTAVVTTYIAVVDGRCYCTFTASAPFNTVDLFSADSWGHGSGIEATYTNIQIELGSSNTSYEAYAGLLCDVSENVFTTTNAQTVIITDNGSDAHAYSYSGDPNPVIPKIENDIEDLQICVGIIKDYGADCPLIVEDAIGTIIQLAFSTASTYLRTGKNICNLGTQTFTQYKKFDLPFKFPAGTYTFSASVATGWTGMQMVPVTLFNGSDAFLTSEMIIVSGGRSHVTLVATSSFDAIALYSADSWGHGSGIQATYTNIQLELGSSYTDYEAYNGTSSSINTNSFTTTMAKTYLFTNDGSDVRAFSYNENVQPVIPQLQAGIEALQEDVETLEATDEYYDGFATRVESINVYKAIHYETTDFVNEAILTSSGGIQTGQSWDEPYMVSPKIAVKPSTQYTISSALWYTISETNRIRAYSADDTALDQMTITANADNTYSFTTPANTAYLRMTIFKDGRTFANQIAYLAGTFMIVEGGASAMPATFEKYFDPYFVFNGVFDENLYPVYLKTTTYGKKIVNFGDSIFGNIRPPFDLSTMIAKYTGATVYNCAFGGCCMSQADGHWDAFCMYNLADAIATDDFTLQDDALEYSDIPSYAAVPLATLEGIDFSDVDTITIAYGTNDFGSGRNALDNENNALDTTTIAGALRYSIETILGAYPAIKIVVLSLIYRVKLSDGTFEKDSDTWTNWRGISIPDINEKLKSVAQEYHIQFIDNYNMGFNKLTYTTYYGDTTHPNSIGLDRLARRISNELE